MGRTMEALELSADDGFVRPRLAWRSIEAPQPGHGELLIRVLACGVCGTDAHCIQTDQAGRIKYSGPLKLPVILGHEFAGEVVETGAGAQGFDVGDIVTCEGLLGCGMCNACRCGHPNQCPNMSMIGLTRPGAFAEYIAVHERFCWSLGGLAERLGDTQQTCEAGALIEPIACSFNGIFIDGGGITPGDTVAVYGAGPLGLAAIALARIAGASVVVAFEPSRPRRDLAAIMGADSVFDPGDSCGNVRDCLRDAMGDHGVDLHVECAGALSDLMPVIEESLACLESAAEGGGFFLSNGGGLAAPPGATPLENIAALLEATKIWAERGQSGSSFDVRC